MLKCGILNNFVFYRQLLKKERKQAEIKKKGGKCSSLCCDISFVCRDTKFQ